MKINISVIKMNDYVIFNILIFKYNFCSVKIFERTDYNISTIQPRYTSNTNSNPTNPQQIDTTTHSQYEINK